MRRAARLLPLTMAAALALAGTGSVAVAGNPVACSFSGGIAFATGGSRATIAVSRGSGGTVLINGTACGAANMNNTERIHIQGNDGAQTVKIFLSSAGFKPGLTNEPGSSDEVEILISLHGGTDALRIYGTGSGDQIRAGTSYNGTFPIPVVNLDSTEASGIDWDVAFSGVESVTILGYEGPDTLSAAGGAGTGDPLHIPIELRGGEQADTLTGGNSGDRLTGEAGQDVMKGAKGNDTLNGLDGAGGDYLGGGGGTDTCTADGGDTKVLCEP